MAWVLHTGHAIAFYHTFLVFRLDSDSK